LVLNPKAYGPDVESVLVVAPSGIEDVIVDDPRLIGERIEIDDVFPDRIDGASTARRCPQSVFHCVML
jgi:hypothetical protein